MSRDFLIVFNNKKDADNAAKNILLIQDQFGNKLFKEIDYRGNSLFVSLTYPNEINEKTYFP